jgi:hypothetical protein
VPIALGQGREIERLAVIADRHLEIRLERIRSVVGIWPARYRRANPVRHEHRPRQAGRNCMVRLHQRRNRSGARRVGIDGGVAAARHAGAERDLVSRRHADWQDDAVDLAGRKARVRNGAPRRLDGQSVETVLVLAAERGLTDANDGQRVCGLHIANPWA